VEGCLACDTVMGTRAAPGGIIHSSDHWVVDHHFGVVMKGFLIVKSRRHCEHVADLTQAELETLGPVLGNATRALQHALDAARVYVCSWGEGDAHVHWCLIPRYGDMPANGVEVVANLWDGRWSCNADEAAALAARVRDLMAL
jgi:diadenosine tetraphosphate (Ap4A) HIT family hydrolase